MSGRRGTCAEGHVIRQDADGSRTYWQHVGPEVCSAGAVGAALKVTCDTLGCSQLAATEVRMAEKRDPEDAWAERLCDECLSEFVRRPFYVVTAP